MYSQHPCAELFSQLRRDARSPKQEQEPEAKAAVLDGCGSGDDGKKAEEGKKPDDGNQSVMDGADVPGAAAEYASTDIALKSVAALQEWAETSPDDLDEGESYATRLSALMLGVVDSDGDGEVGDNEAAVLEAALESAWDYLSAKGVSDEDISALLNDWDDAAADRVQEKLASSLPDGEEAAARDIDDFVFGDGSDEATFDAVYKKRLVIRDGKKLRINKRISGFVKKTAKQKIAIRKMQRRSHNAVATMHRMKSMKIRRKMGI